MRPLRLIPLWQALSWLLVAAAVYLSLGPTDAVTDVWVFPFPYHDKVGHFLAYLGLTLWFCGIYRRNRFHLIAPALLLLGVAMEMVQGALPHRSADLGDFLANTAGIGVGMALALAGLDRWCVWLERRVVSWAT